MWFVWGEGRSGSEYIYTGMKYLWMGWYEKMDHKEVMASVHGILTLFASVIL